MNGQSNPESINPQEKSVEQAYKELNQAHDEIMKLMDQVHELEMKAAGDGISKEDFDSIVDERNKLAAQLNEKWEAKKQLEEQCRKVEKEEIKKLEEDWKKSPESF